PPKRDEELSADYYHTGEEWGRTGEERSETVATFRVMPTSSIASSLSFQLSIRAVRFLFRFLHRGGRSLEPGDECRDLRGEEGRIAGENGLTHSGQRPGRIAGRQPGGVDRVLEPRAAGEAVGE